MNCAPDRAAPPVKSMCVSWVTIAWAVVKDGWREETGLGEGRRWANVVLTVGVGIEHVVRGLRAGSLHMLSHS